MYIFLQKKNFFVDLIMQQLIIYVKTLQENTKHKSVYTQHINDLHYNFFQVIFLLILGIYDITVKVFLLCAHMKLLLKTVSIICKSASSQDYFLCTKSHQWQIMMLKQDSTAVWRMSENIQKLKI